ncbi:MAG: hypothetical protein DDT26_00241 [Dehalococcoidia bacterium]|nr:hypothetical protein [Chloroflexota bacterium]
MSEFQPWLPPKRLAKAPFNPRVFDSGKVKQRGTKGERYTTPGFKGSVAGKDNVNASNTFSREELESHLIGAGSDDPYLQHTVGQMDPEYTEYAQPEAAAAYEPGGPMTQYDAGGPMQGYDHGGALEGGYRALDSSYQPERGTQLPSGAPAGFMPPNYETFDVESHEDFDSLEQAHHGRIDSMIEHLNNLRSNGANLINQGREAAQRHYSAMDGAGSVVSGAVDRFSEAAPQMGQDLARGYKQALSGLQTLHSNLTQGIGALKQGSQYVTGGGLRSDVANTSLGDIAGRTGAVARGVGRAAQGAYQSGQQAGQWYNNGGKAELASIGSAAQAAIANPGAAARTAGRMAGAGIRKLFGKSADGFDLYDVDGQTCTLEYFDGEPFFTPHDPSIDDLYREL